MGERIKKLPLEFYRRDNVVEIAKELLGKILVTNFNDEVTTARIVEVEAYEGEIDRASHAYAGRRTRRTEKMFMPGGIAYVYLCYGIHHLFNVVTHGQNIPHAILIRGAEPLQGTDIMLARTGKESLDHTLTRGPGNVSKALGITTEHTGHSLLSKEIFIGDDGLRYKKNDVIASPRIGVDYAGTHALWPYRFYVKQSPYVSGPKLKSDR